MKTRKRKIIIKNLKLLSLTLWFCVFSFLLLACLSTPVCWAVTSRITRHSSSEDLLKGEVEDVIVGSKGTLQLGRSAEMLVEEFEVVCETPDEKKNAKQSPRFAKKRKTSLEPWSINSIVVSGGTVYLGTSPNGGIYKYSLGKLTKIYPIKSQESESTEPGREPNDVNQPGDVNEPVAETVEAEQYLSNEHIFAMATDVAGRLLAGISGDKCRLIRFEAKLFLSRTMPKQTHLAGALSTSLQ